MNNKWHVKKGKVFYGQDRASQWRIYYHRKWGQLSTTCSNAPKQPTGELPVTVNHNQLRTMASETVYPIDWSHPPPLWAVPPERLVHSINQCNLSGIERATAACEATTLPMRPLRVCGSILFTEADRALTLTYSSVSHIPLFSDYESITLSHIMTHDIMINERKIKCFIKRIFLLVSFYLYPFTCIYNVCKS